MCLFGVDPQWVVWVVMLVCMGGLGRFLGLVTTVQIKVHKESLILVILP